MWLEYANLWVTAYAFPTEALPVLGHAAVRIPIFALGPSIPTYAKFVASPDAVTSARIAPPASSNCMSGSSHTVVELDLVYLATTRIITSSRTR